MGKDSAYSQYVAFYCRSGPVSRYWSRCSPFGFDFLVCGRLPGCFEGEGEKYRGRHAVVPAPSGKRLCYFLLQYLTEGLPTGARVVRVFQGHCLGTEPRERAGEQFEYVHGSTYIVHNGDVRLLKPASPC